MSNQLDCFEIVWQTVNETYSDPTFGGLDWQAMHDIYRPRIVAAEDDETFYDLLNQMLHELKVSHIGALPPEWALDKWMFPHDFGQVSIGQSHVNGIWCKIVFYSNRPILEDDDAADTRLNHY